MSKLPKWHPDANPDDAADRIPMYSNGVEFRILKSQVKELLEEGFKLHNDDVEDDLAESTAIETDTEDTTTIDNDFVDNGQDVENQQPSAWKEKAVDIMQSTIDPNSSVAEQAIKGAAASSIGKLADTAIAAGAGIAGAAAEGVGNITGSEYLLDKSQSLYDVAEKHWKEPVVESAIQGEPPTTKTEKIANAGGQAVGMLAPMAATAKGLQIANTAFKSIGGSTRVAGWVDKINNFIEAPINWQSISSMFAGGAAAEAVHDENTSDGENFFRGLSAFLLASTTVTAVNNKIIRSIGNEISNVKNIKPNRIENYLLSRLKLENKKSDVSDIAVELLKDDINLMSMYNEKSDIMYYASIFPHTAYYNTLKNINQKVSNVVEEVLNNSMGIEANRANAVETTNHLTMFYTNLRQDIANKAKASFEKLNTMVNENDFVDGTRIAAAAEKVYKRFYSPTLKHTEDGQLLLDSLQSISTEFKNNRVPLTTVINQYRDINRMFRLSLDNGRDATRSIISLNTTISKAIQEGGLNKTIAKGDKVFEQFKKSNLEYKNFEVPMIELELTKLMSEGSKPHRINELLGTEEGIIAFDNAIDTISHVGREFVKTDTSDIGKLALQLKRNKAQQILVDNIRADSQYRPGRFLDTLRGKDALVIEKLIGTDAYAQLRTDAQNLSEIAIDINTALKQSRTVVGLNTDVERTEKIYHYMLKQGIGTAVGGIAGYTLSGLGGLVSGAVAGALANKTIANYISNAYARILTEPKYAKYVLESYKKGNMNAIVKKIDKLTIPMMAIDAVNVLKNNEQLSE